MSEFITSLIELLFSVPGLAIVAGLLSAWGGTQAAKQHWHFGGRRAVIVALVLGFLPTYLIWPGHGAVPASVGLAVGLIAPGAYKVAIAIVRKRWPEIAAELSGDRQA